MIPRLSPGQSIMDVLTVKTWDQIVSAVERVKQIDRVLSELRSSQSGKGTAVLVQNDTGGDLDQYSIVRLDGLLLTPSSDEINLELPPERQPFSGKSISIASQWHKLAIFQTPVADGDLAPALITGVSYALVDVSDEDHIRAYPDGTSCKSGAGPLRILYAPEPGGSRAAIVVFDYGTQHYLAKANSSIAAGASGTCKILNGATLTNIQITAKNVSNETVPGSKVIGVQEESSLGTNYISFEVC